MEDTRSLVTVPDDELLRRLAELLRHSRRVEADLVAHIGEVDARRLYAREASPSMFVYCTQALHLSEFEAYLRITVARAARLHPVLLEMLREGSIHLSSVAKLAPHLTPENRDTLLARAAHRSKREVEELIAEIAPRPDALTVIRKLPDRGVAFDSGAGLGLDRVEPPRIKHANATVVEVLAGMPRGERTTTEPLIQTQQQLAGVAGHVGPASAARARLARVEPLSPARYKVEFTAGAGLHGGEHSLANISLQCRRHNNSLAEVDYGREAMERHVTGAVSSRRASRAARAEPPGLSGAPNAPWHRSAPAG